MGLGGFEFGPVGILSEGDFFGSGLAGLGEKGRGLLKKDGGSKTLRDAGAPATP